MNILSLLTFLYLSFHANLLFAQAMDKSQYQEVRDIEDQEQLPVQVTVLSKSKIKSRLDSNPKKGIQDLKNVQIKTPEHFKETDFSKIKNMQGLDLSKCRLARCCFQGGDLSNSQFKETLFGGCTSCAAFDCAGSDALFPNFNKANLKNANFERAQFHKYLNPNSKKGMVFNEVDLSGAKFNFVQAQGLLSFLQSNLSHADFYSASGNFEFAQANLEGAIFNQTDLMSSTFNQTSLKDVQFINCKGNISLENMDISGVDFSLCPNLSFNNFQNVTIDSKTKFNDNQMFMLMSRNYQVIMDGQIISLKDFYNSSLDKDKNDSSDKCQLKLELAGAEKEMTTKEMSEKLSKILEVLIQELTPEGKKKLQSMLRDF